MILEFVAPYLSSLASEEWMRGFFFDTIQMEVGEYAEDQGFLLPNPVSIHPEYLRLRFEIARCTQKLQKMKLLGIEC